MTAVTLAAVQRDDVLLDVAAGTGGLLRELARSGTRPAEVVGVDRSPSALAFASCRLPMEWRLTVADARQLPFADASFDVVTVCFLLQLLDRRERGRVLSEVARVLRPTGRVVLVTVHTPRAITRAALGMLPRSWGLRPLDPTADLRAAGLVAVRGRFVRTGWPSLCMLGTPVVS